MDLMDVVMSDRVGGEMDVGDLAVQAPQERRLLEGQLCARAVSASRALGDGCPSLRRPGNEDRRRVAQAHVAGKPGPDELRLGFGDGIWPVVQGAVCHGAENANTIRSSGVTGCVALGCERSTVSWPE